MRHLSTDPRCPRCALKPALCICERLPRLATRTHVCFVTHKLEDQKSTNTGRLARAVLSNTSLCLFGNDLPALPRLPWPTDHRPVVLFPQRGAPEVGPALLDDERPLALVVLDGTWRQANRWRKRFLVERVPFAVPPPGGPGRYRLRTAPGEQGLCTIEAVARALGALEGSAVEHALVDALELFQSRLLWLRGAIDRADVVGGLPEHVRRQDGLGAPAIKPP